VAWMAWSSTGALVAAGSLQPVLTTFISPWYWYWMEH
jgi:hypothetical protein